MTFEILIFALRSLFGTGKMGGGGRGSDASLYMNGQRQSIFSGRTVSDVRGYVETRRAQPMITTRPREYVPRGSTNVSIKSPSITKIPYSEPTSNVSAPSTFPKRFM